MVKNANAYGEGKRMGEAQGADKGGMTLTFAMGRLRL